MRIVVKLGLFMNKILFPECKNAQIENYKKNKKKTKKKKTKTKTKGAIKNKPCASLQYMNLL